MSERKIPSLKQTIPMGAAARPASAQRTTQPIGTPRDAMGLARDTIKDPPRKADPEAASQALLDGERAAAETKAFVEAAQNGPGVAALRALSAEAAAPAPPPTPSAPGEAYRQTPLDERATLPRSAKQEARAVVVPAAPVPNAPVGAKVDVSRADLRRAPTQKITRRPNEYIPPDDSDVLGPAPGARPPPGVLAGPRPRVVQPVRAGGQSTLLYVILAIVCVCAVAATITWAIFRGRPAPAPAPTAQEASRGASEARATATGTPATATATATSAPATATATATTNVASPAPRPAQAAPSPSASGKPPRDKDGLIFD